MLIENYEESKNGDIKIYQTNIRELFEQLDNVYRVDVYQRKYSWKDDQIKDLLEDYNKIIDSKKDHYLGVITLVRKDTNRYSIVDGQQRLLTNIILLCVLRDCAFKLELNTFAREIQKNLIMCKDGIKIQACKNDSDLLAIFTEVYSSSKEKFIDEYSENKGVYDKAIKYIQSNLESPTKERDILRKYNIINTYSFFYSNIVEKLNSENNILAKRKILESYKEVLFNVSIIVVLSESRDNIFLLFNSLNNKGLMLSQFDVIRNLFFSCIQFKSIDESYYEEFGEYWDKLVCNLEDIDILKFLKYYMMCKINKIRNIEEVVKDFQDIFKSECLTVEHTFSFLEDLCKYAEIYKQLFCEYEDSEYGDSHYYIHQFGQEACYSFLMKCIHEFSDDLEFIKKIFKEIEGLSLGRKLTGKSVKNLDNIFNELITNINDRQNIVESVKKKKITRNEIENSIKLSDRIWKSDKVVKYIFQKQYGRDVGTIKRISSDEEEKYVLGNYYASKKEQCSNESDVALRTSKFINMLLNWSSDLEDM
nr:MULTISPECIES: DUF262 domain-containing protein [Clostridium]